MKGTVLSLPGSVESGSAAARVRVPLACIEQTMPEDVRLASREDTGRQLLTHVHIKAWVFAASCCLLKLTARATAKRPHKHPPR